jgi:hypothetical protein
MSSARKLLEVPNCQTRSQGMLIVNHYRHVWSRKNFPTTAGSHLQTLRIGMVWNSNSGSKAGFSAVATMPSALIRTDPVPLKIPDPLSARGFARRSAVSLPWLGSWSLGLRSVSTASRSAVSPRLGAGRDSGSGDRLAGAPVVSGYLATDGEILCGEGIADASMCPDRWRSECVHPGCVQPAAVGAGGAH